MHAHVHVHVCMHWYVHVCVCVCVCVHEFIPVKMVTGIYIYEACIVQNSIIHLE